MVIYPYIKLTPVKKFFDAFPQYKGRKFLLIAVTKWGGVRVLISGVEHPQCFSPRWFR